jgi:hypothetical protein
MALPPQPSRSGSAQAPPRSSGARPNDAATRYAHIRADLKKRGQMIGANDLFIAAHARSLGLRLITKNAAEFGGVKRLTLENWTVPVRRSCSRENE